MDLEKIFEKTAEELPTKNKDLLKQEFLAEVRIQAEDWIDEKLKIK